MERAEVRRLVDWFLLKFENEVTRHITRERVYKLQMAAEMGGSAPDLTAIRAARTNIRQHMKYIDWLAATRDWLAGAHPLCRHCGGGLHFRARLSGRNRMGRDQSGARLVCTHEIAPRFPSAASDRVRGLAPVAHYGDLDF